MSELLKRSWSVHADDHLWIQANDSDGMVVADPPYDPDDMTDEQFEEWHAIFEHIVDLHNESLLETP